MQIFTRAGLVIALSSVLIALVSAVPLPLNENGSVRSLKLQASSPIHTSGVAHAARVAPTLIHNDGLGGPQAVLASSPPIVSPSSPRKGLSRTDDSPVLVRRTSIKQRLHNLHEKVKAAFHKFGQKVKAGFQKFGQKVKAGFQKFGQKLKVGFQKVGHFLKTTGAKIVKFALKVVSTVQKVAAKVIGFIPGVGKVLGKGLEAASKVTGKISDSIHVSLGKKLDKGMAVMNKVQKVTGYIPRDFVEYDDRDALGWDFDPREEYMDFVERDMGDFGYDAGLFM